uniref:Inhibitor of growth family member 5 n=1 Tax=Nomascus leucogenys TaxID=61853 RepID=A0A2I3HXS6_NOMLE
MGARVTPQDPGGLRGDSELLREMYLRRGLLSPPHLGLVKTLSLLQTLLSQHPGSVNCAAATRKRLVDKHIRRLDADLARFEADLKDKMEGSDFESSGGRGLKKGRGQKEKRGSRGRGRRTSEEDTPKKKKHKGGLPAPSCSEPEGPVPTVPFLRESGTPPGLLLTQCCFSRWQCCSCPIARCQDGLVRPQAPSRGTGGWCRWADGSS